jgi:ribosomal protein S18 acetylase RimI-like enzyme
MESGLTMSFHTISDPDELHVHFKAIASVLRACFPGKYPAASEADLTLEESAGFHDLSDTMWILLWNKNSALSSELVGLVAVAPYHNGVYVFNLCVKPTYRRQGWALKLLERAGEIAAQKNTPALLGNVDANNKALIQFYCALGADIVESAGIGSGGAAQSTVRVAAVLPGNGFEIPQFFELQAHRRRVERQRRAWWLMGAAGALALAIAIAVASTRLARHNPNPLRS